MTLQDLKDNRDSMIATLTEMIDWHIWSFSATNGRKTTDFVYKNILNL